VKLFYFATFEKQHRIKPSLFFRIEQLVQDCALSYG